MNDIENLNSFAKALIDSELCEVVYVTNGNQIYWKNRNSVETGILEIKWVLTSTVMQIYSKFLLIILVYLVLSSLADKSYLYFVPNFL